MTNLEEIKAITDLLMGIGAEAKSAFIWWLVFDKLLPVLTWLTTLITGLYFIKSLVDPTSKLKALRDAMGVGIPGIFMESEYREMLQWIRDRK